MRKIYTLALVGISFALLATEAERSQSASQDDVAKRFVGTWRLVSITLNGGVNPSRGPNPTGFIMYDAFGNMAAQIMPDRNRPRYAGSQPTAEEAKAALAGYTAYFGTYTVDVQAGTVTHHRTGDINPTTPDVLVRRFEFAADGDRVSLNPVELPASRLTWERVKSAK